jgi:hypothetical protein
MSDRLKNLGVIWMNDGDDAALKYGKQAIEAVKLQIRLLQSEGNALKAVVQHVKCNMEREDGNAS